MKTFKEFILNTVFEANILVMLVGVPASGKSTFIRENEIDSWAVVASTDNYIDELARKSGLSYSDVFEVNMKAANMAMNLAVSNAVTEGQDIVWDQTNLTVKSRKQKLDKVTSDYTKIGVFFPTPEPVEHARRIDSRPGKNIPISTLNYMIDVLQFPTLDEGFDIIFTYGVDIT